MAGQAEQGAEGLMQQEAKTTPELEPRTNLGGKVLMRESEPELWEPKRGGKNNSIGPSNPITPNGGVSSAGECENTVREGAKEEPENSTPPPVAEEQAKKEPTSKHGQVGGGEAHRRRRQGVQPRA